jgi:hypothetical protein
MRKFAFKTLFSLLTLNKADRRPPNWGRIILIFSTLVTIGLVVLYAYGKTTGRW